MDLLDEVERIVTSLSVRGPRMSGHLVTLVTGMLTRPRSPDVPGGNPLKADQVVDMIEKHRFADWEQPFGWIMRDGFVMPAGHSSHDYLLHFLGIEPADAEDQGYARASEYGWQCLYRLSPEQRRSLTVRGFAVDMASERLKNQRHGLPPYEETIHPSRRLPR